MGIRKIKKSVAVNSFMFPLEMYNSLPGSIVITSCILNNEKPDLLFIRKKWKYYTRHSLGFDLSDPEYIKKVCDLFNVKMINTKYAAFVQSEYNALVCPFVDGHVWPLREDGRYARTLIKGKVYPLSEEGLKNGTTEEK